MSGGAASAKTANYVLVAADAGTAISMTSTSATTITVNTGLFAAGDTVFIQNLGTANLTITAGTATVNTAGSLILPQYDAGILYFVSSSSAVFYDYIQVGAASPLTTKGDLYTFGTSDTRLGVGANDTVLTADSTAATGLKWAAPAGGSSFAGVSAYKSAVQSINNSTWTALTFDTENFDTNTFHDNSTNNTRLTIPTGKGGYYSIGGNIVFAGNATGIRAVGIYKNGSAFVYVSGIPGGVASDIRANFAYVMSLTAGDYVEVYALQTSGGALNIMSSQSDTTFSAYLIGV
jgi:hypothetical protein